ncbi:MULTISPECIES: bifunctional 23S rRNA (guanine(2069)-N(7))-methyltransferase RlmK/23S rRNA (guanine(2445)-N(2))-methyltransferase RlmL [Thiorhodovibrio]|uniref:bifunctional 23S rRNA (guanine(2069)-N(7))-methyltransferase RlmK/23S rRNA (guanine(2445)-N(2))-methyltransferase RlmL n=1 Tax=Thiorhodovibrio TaxID=61593 RepID=UPI001912011F|nr:bifunctional 23S rRNA (guanine(2069)-N(7))-methyltransferase RlmK/23S rRNA (guanine(2445)-N(2))-methyltransferase RlmL [Thiorhodovibrio litoralis]MBK5968071.1 23S rRNA (guanine(2445)-N(2))/(guanine(2069)-N(7))-methyltransferase [Thiorhodovibrio winogradskyi]WPL11888.1 Ribosomal RNA large subunit methyltransferase K/L [Thiorhodovibrio litoralis]
MLELATPPSQAPDQHHFFVTAARHLETLLAEELRGLGIPEVRETRAGVACAGALADAYRVCLWSRVASRVLLPLAEWPAADPDALYAGIAAIDWSQHLGPEQTLAIHVDSARSGIDHTHFAALRIKDAIVDQFRERSGQRPSVDTAQPDIRLYCRLFRDQAALSLDLSGDALHRRGYRTEAGAASIKENLAAALLLRARWPAIAAAGGALVDPMCGAGTLVIEAALMAADRAPGLNRAHWGFSAWRGHDAAAWNGLREEAEARASTGLESLGRLCGYDRDSAAIRMAYANLERAGLAGRLHFERRELADCQPCGQARQGLVISNPPYGERLGAKENLVPLYRTLGHVLRERFDGWQGAVLTANPELGRNMGLRAHRTHRLFNGPLDCQLLHFDIRSEAHVDDSPRPLPPEERGPGAAMLANRLRKNQKSLNSWLKQQDIGCYRLYDADLPEYALAIDIYSAAAADANSGADAKPGTSARPGTSMEDDAGKQRLAHVQEYAAPPDIDPRAARRRLREAMGVIGETLGIARENLFFKVRQRQRGNAQYDRQGQAEQFFEVREAGLRFLVNLQDHLDTGLFLDHRQTRALIGQLAQGKRFLNLFGYTGAASVHAAAGGALSTLTVDLSRTYCDWAQRNLTLNGFTPPAHRVEQADCLQWIERPRWDKFGLIFLDPPSFSTSKRMRGSFDIQRDHVRLIQQTARLLEPDGKLIFSTNLRRFKLDADALTDLEIEDLKPRTLPRDFKRNARIHHCWRLRHRH